MHDVHEIDDNLRTIRRLMERGQRYEAITGRGALVVGLLSLGVAAVVHRIDAPFGRLRELGASESLSYPPAFAFGVAWPLLAIVSAAALLRAALRIPAAGGDPDARRLSGAARAVVGAVIPPYLLALALAVASLVATQRAGLFGLSIAGLWAALHGIAILSTSYHAPRRLVFLGWAFLAAGCVDVTWRGAWRHELAPNVVMALTFGGLHLAYGLYSVLRPLPSED